VINFPNQLNTALLSLKSRVDGHDPKPTAGMETRLIDLLHEWSTYSKDLDKIINDDMKAFNDAFKKSGVDILKVPEKN